LERIRNRRLELILGFGLIATIVVAIGLIYQTFQGQFGSDVFVSAKLSQAGDALSQGDIVTYRDTIVGEVSSSTGNIDGSASLRLKIHHGAAQVIPANVTVLAVPQSLFGATKILLVPGVDTSGPHLNSASFLQPDLSPAAESLQTALSRAYALLTAVRPAQLDAALSAIAAALDGQGQNLGNLIVKTDHYLAGLGPHLGELNSLLDSLATVSTEIANNAPELLHSVSNLLTVSKGIVASRQSVANLLAIAPTAVDNANAVLSPANVNNLVAVLVDQTPVLQAFANNPNALPGTIHGFKSFADVFSGAIRNNELYGDALLSGANYAEVSNTLAGRRSGVFDSVSDPPLYTTAQCPRYNGASGGNCGAIAGTASANSVLLTTGNQYQGKVGADGSPAELAAVTSAAHVIAGVPLNANATIVDLLLGPVLRGMPTVIK
jgi:virulence factor Mce-like protein